MSSQRVLTSASAKEFIQEVTSPIIGAICSPGAEELCLKNNLNFVTMIQPFSKIAAEGRYIDTVTIKYFMNPTCSPLS